MATVYIDVLFLINFIINILLIEAGGVINNAQLLKRRTLFASALGALYAVCVFFPQLKLFYSVIMKLFFSAVMVFFAYRPKSVRMFLRLFAAFYAVSFIFGGFVIALTSLTSLGYRTGAIYSNGVLYMNLPWQALLLFAAAAYAFVVTVGAVRRKKLAEEAIKRNVTVFLNGRSADFEAIIDTGNSLFDPISGDPVIVCERNALEEIFPEEKPLIELLETGGARVRMVPFSSVGKESGILPGFLPDMVKIDGMAASKCVVCICEARLSPKRDYGALINPMIAVKESFN